MSDEDPSAKPHSFDWGFGKKDPEPQPPELIEPPQPPSWELPTQLTPQQPEPPQPPSWELPTQLTPEQPQPPQQPAPFLPPPPLPPEPRSWQQPPGPPPLAPELRGDLDVVAPQPVHVEDDEVAGIESLFGEGSFREYEDAPVLQQVPFPTRGGRREIAERPPRADRTGAPRILLVIAAAVVGVFVLVLLFNVGTRLDLTPAAGVTTVPTTAPTTAAPSTPTPKPTEALAPGPYAWDELRGGECLSDFQNSWQETYTVVDCAAEHTGQLIVTGLFDDASYPGADELASRMTIICTSLRYVDYKAAGAYDDIQVSSSYPQTQAQWDAGDHEYYCFMSRAGGAAITGNLSKDSRA